MVLVTESWRRRGLATKLVDACLAAAAKQGLVDLARCDAGGRHRLWPARICADAAAAAAAARACDVDQGRSAAVAVDLRSKNSSRAIVSPWASIAASCSANSADVRAPGCCRTAMRLRSSATAARPGISARCWRMSPEQALALVNEIVWSESGPLLIDAVYEQEEFLNGLTGSGWKIERPFQRMRFGPPPQRRLPNCRSPSPARNMDRDDAPCIIATSNPRCGA